jgi:mannitol operon transcriptional antiterminator
MKKITSRQKEIILMIAKNPMNIPVTISEIAKELNLSTRTVLRDMPSIEDWSDENHFEFIKKPGIGLMLNESLENKQYIIELLQDENIGKGYTKAERKLLILSNLLTTNEPIKSYYFTKLLKVSEGTLNNDFLEVNSWLEKFHIKHFRKPGMGSYLEGEENNFRNAYINLIHESYNEKEIINMVRNIGKGIKSSSIIQISSEDRLLKLIDKSIINKVENGLTREMKELHMNLSDSSYVGLVVHISLAMQRIKNGEKIVMDKAILEDLKIMDQFNVAKKIADGISKDFNIEIPIDEIGYITMHIKGSKLRVSSMDDKFNLDNLDLVNITKKLIRLGEIEFEITLSNDDRLLNDLINHLGPSICRIKMGMIIRNPLLQEIKTNYIDVYKGVEKIVNVIKDRVNIETIPDSEIAYITMHFASAIERILATDININVVVACPTGIGTSRFLVTKIEKKFHNINVLEAISSLKIDEEYLKNKDVDLIISTIDIDTNLDYISVTPFMNIDDEKIIKNKIVEIAMKKVTNAKFTKTLTSHESINSSEDDVMELMYIAKEAIEFVEDIRFVEDKKCSNLEELVNITSELFTNSKEDKNIICNDLNRRINISSPYVEDIDIILLHCATSRVESIKSAVIRLQQPINLDNAKRSKYVLCMLIPIEAKKYQREIMSCISKQLIEDIGFVEDIKISNENKIKQNIKKVILDFYSNKLNLISF